ncbi:hypothetical protein [Microbacterium wangruii]|uniref:hypothetical protein n=1 Tax=Microbacterium wangruii TaxID=3049073 RepID=UPI00256F2D13|nr:hypothetical protein [Microbacterium sp. zg-Y1211]MDL5485939.1 hypothetical protein [Microbacterium sp. zg-Y1211]
MALLSTPLLALIFALGGTGLAWLWFNSLTIVAIVAVLLLIMIGWGLGALARTALPDRPVRAVQLMDGQVVAIAGTTAAAAAIAIIIGVTIVAPEVASDAPANVKQTAAELKAVLTAVATALSAFITSLALKAENIDTTIGDRVKAMFYDAYPGETPAATAAAPRPADPKRQRVLPMQSRAEQAVYSDGAIPDWSRPNRLLRAKRLQKEIDEGRASVPHL